MSEEALFIENYPEVALNRISMLWNGERGFAFDDQNQGFRERVILMALTKPSEINGNLLFELMHEEAIWASRALSYRYYLPELAEYLLCHDFNTNAVRVAIAFSRNKQAMKSLVELKVHDDLIKKWLEAYKGLARRDETNRTCIEAMGQGLKEVLLLREEEAQKKADFEAYLTHKDPLAIALKKWLKHVWQETELHYLALFFIVPIVLLLGYYVFGLSILYGMLPLFRTLILLYIIYRIIAKIVG